MISIYLSNKEDLDDRTIHLLFSANRWGCKAPEVGLPTPDLVLYLDITPEIVAERGDYGGE